MKKSELKQIIKEEIQKALNEGLDAEMFFQNLNTIKRGIDSIMELDKTDLQRLLNDDGAWIYDHITTSKDDVQEVADYIAGWIDFSTSLADNAEDIYPLDEKMTPTQLKNREKYVMGMKKGKFKGSKPDMYAIATSLALREKKLAAKDYDGDGKLETPEKEYKGSVDKAIKANKSKK
jgi:hypothetical protein